MSFEFDESSWSAVETCVRTSRWHVLVTRQGIRSVQSALLDSFRRLTEAQAAINRTDVLLRSIRKEMICRLASTRPVRH